MAQAPYSQYRNPALGPSLCEDGPRQNSSAGMQRSTSQSTNCTIDSCYSASSCSSGYHTADCSSTGFPIDDGPCFDSSYSVYPSSYFDSQDTDHLVLATGSQYQHAGQQLPRALQVYTPLHLFDNSLGNVEQTSQQATDNASSWIANERVYGRYELSVVTSQAVKDAQRELQGLGLEASPRAAVQKVIYDVLYSHFNDTDSCFTDAGTVLDEAAYQLQRHLQGPEAIQICYFAIVSKLLELRANLENESYGGQTIVLESPSGKATQSSTQIFAEKEKYICEYPGCGKEASRPADRDRHFRIVHLKEEDKTKYLCDYKKCSRHTNPFFRQDHFRDHLRIYHKEDLLRRGNRGDREWWESRAPRALFGGWWRCSRCLVRVTQSSNGFVCAGCGNPCESERQRRRLNARA